MAPHYFIISLFVFSGIVSLLAAVLDWDWFFTAQNTRFIVRRLGRHRARWCYGVLGVVLLGMAVVFFWQLSQVA